MYDRSSSATNVDSVRLDMFARKQKSYDATDQRVLERFVITMYDRSSSATNVDSVRLDMFARKQKSYDAISPNSAALVQLIKRAAY